MKPSISQLLAVNTERKVNVTEIQPVIDNKIRHMFFEENQSEKKLNKREEK
jgi:hypothetical protein